MNVKICHLVVHLNAHVPYHSYIPLYQHELVSTRIARHLGETTNFFFEEDIPDLVITEATIECCTISMVVSSGVRVSFSLILPPLLCHTHYYKKT